MYNELIFVSHVVVVSASVLLALRHSYGALLSVLSIQLIVANLFVTKQIVIAGMLTTCSEVFIVSGMYGISLVQAYYGDKRARQTIFYTFAFLLLFVLLSRLHIWYEPVTGNTVAEALSALLAPAPRLMAASLSAYIISERVHLYAARWLSARGVSSLARILAIGLGQVVDTLTFALIGLYGMVPGLRSIMIVSLVVKAVVIIALAPLLTLARALVPNSIIFTARSDNE